MKHIVTRRENLKYQKVGYPSECGKGKRREFARSKALSLLKELNKTSNSDDKAFAMGLHESIRLGPGPALRDLESMSLDAVPLIRESEHHKSYRLRLALFSHVKNYVDNSKDVEYVDVVKELFTRLSAKTKMEVRSVLSDINPLNCGEVKLIRELNVALGGGPLRHEVIVPQMFSLGISDIAKSMEGLGGVVEKSTATLTEAMRDVAGQVSNTSIKHTLDMGFSLPNSIMDILNMLFSMLGGVGAIGVSIDFLWPFLDRLGTIPTIVKDAITKTFKWICDLITAKKETSGEFYASRDIKMGERVHIGVRGGHDEESPLVAQAGDPDRESLVTILFRWLPYILGAKFATLFLESDLVVAVSKVSQLASDYVFGIRTITGFFNTIKLVMSHLLSLLGFDKYAALFTHHPAIYEAKTAMEEFNTKIESGFYVPTLVEAQKVTKIVSDLEESFKSAVKAKSVDVPIIKDLLDRMRKVNVVTSHAYKNNRTRIVPTVIGLTSAPGVGKTYATMTLAAALSVSRSSDEELKKSESMPPGTLDSTGFISGVSSYADGLKGGEKVIIYDEFMAVKDTGTGDNTSLAEFTSAISDAPHDPVMAAVEKKGNILFDPQYVILITNVSRFGPDQLKSMVSPEAVLRRITFKYHVKVKDEFAMPDGKLDIAKVEAEKPDDDVFWSPLLFFPYDMARGVATGEEPLELIDVHNRAVEHRIISEQRHERKLHGIDAVRAALIARRRLELAPQGNFPSSVYDDDEFSEDGAKELKCADGEDADKVWLADTHLMTPEQEKHLDDALCGKVSYNPDLFLDQRKMVRFKIQTMVEAAKLRYQTAVYTARSVVGGLTDVFERIRARIPYIGLITAVVAVTGVVMAVSRSFEIVGQSVTSETSGRRTRRVVRKTRSQLNALVKPLPAPVAATGVVPQADMDQASLNVINKVYQNLFEIRVGPLIKGTCKLEATPRRCGFSLCVGGSLYSIPRHYCSQLDDKYVDYLNGKCDKPYAEFKPVGGKGSGFIVPVEELLKRFVVKDGDFKTDKAWVLMPKDDCGNSVIKPRPKVSHHIIMDSRPGKSWLVQPDHEGHLSITPTTTYSCAKTYNSRGEDYDLGDGIRYAVSTESGMCGALIFTRDDDGNMGLAGFHTAGYQSGDVGGFGVRFCSDDDMALVSTVPNTVDRRLGIPASLGVKYSTGFKGTMDVLGTIKPSQTPPSKIEISDLPRYAEISGKIPASLKPIMVDGCRVDPAELSNLKYSKSTVFIEPRVLEAAASAVFGKIIMNTAVKHEVRHISVKEALRGYDHMTMMKRSSSGGLFMQREFGLVDKRPIMGAEGDIDENAPYYGRFVELTEKVLDDIANDVPFTAVYKDVIKDEVLPADKALAGKARKISGLDMVSAVVCRMAYGAQINTLLDPANRINNGSAVGINPMSGDWEAIVNKVGDNVMCTDFGGFDGSLGHQLLHTVFNVLDNLCPTSDTTILKYRAWARDSVVSSVHAYGDLVLEWCGSNPSGNLLTTLVNNIAQGIIFQLCISKHVLTNCRFLLDMPPALPREHFIDAEGTYGDQFETDDPKVAKMIAGLFELVEYGDDGIIGIGDPLVCHINTYDLAVAASDYGWTITNGDKTSPFERALPPHAIERASFLKRDFRFDGSRWVAPLEMGSIYQSLGYRKKGATVEQRQQVIDNACREFALHGVEVYEKEIGELYNDLVGSDNSIPYMGWAEAYAAALSSDMTMWTG